MITLSIKPPAIGDAARTRAEHWLQVVQAQRAQRRWSAAEQALDCAAEVGGRDAAASALVGDFCVRIEDFVRAARAYDRAITLQPECPVYWFNRAAVRRFLGLLEQAEADYDRCLELDPSDAQAHLNRSELRPQTPGRNHIAQLEQYLAGTCRRWQQQVQLRYALAKEYEDVGRYTDAWSQLTTAAALRRRHLAYDPRPDLQTVDWLIEAFARAPLARSGDPTPEPIFVLGMPRTGSTLVDRMISSHSQVQSAGELLHLGCAVVAAARRRLQQSGRGGSPARRELILASADIDQAALGADYLARTRPHTGRRPRFTDKLPLNYLYCGIIAAARPAADIIHVRRHPLATCYAVFKVLFDQGYPFSYDLTEIADYYIGYRRLMDHWAEILPGRLIDVSYEALIADPAGQCRRMVGALGLAWEDGCLAFSDNPSPTTTASASQVRRPLYTDAVDRWRHYQAQLEPVRRRLVAAGIDCD